MTVSFHITTDCWYSALRSRFVCAVARTFLCATVLSLGCKSQPNAAIGYAYLGPQPKLLQVVQETLDARAGGTGRSNVRVVSFGDSIHVRGPVAHVRHAVRLVARDGMVGVVGHIDSRTSLLVAPIYNEAGVVQLVPSGTNPRLADAGEWTFTLAPSDSVLGEFMGRFVAEHLHARDVTVFYIGDLYGTSLRDAVASDLRRRRVNVVRKVPFGARGSCQPFSPENTMLRTVTALQDAIPDVTVVIGPAIPVGCLARLIHERHPHLPIVLGDMGGLEVLRRAAGPAASSMYVTAGLRPDTTDVAALTFLLRFRRIVGRSPQPGEAKAFDALMLLATAIETVGSDPEDVRAYLAGLGRATPPYRGVTGEAAFGQPGPPSLMMTHVHDGALVQFANR